MIFKLLKFNNTKWVMIPQRNTLQEVIDIYKTVDINEFNELFETNIIEDNNGNPDTLTATKMIQHYRCIEDIEFELYEYL